MTTYPSGDTPIRIDQSEPSGSGSHPALLLLHGSGGAVSYWFDRFAPVLAGFGVAAYAPHYFDKTGTHRATVENILDGQHFNAWLAAIRDAVSDVAARPSVDPQRIGVLGVSLGGYLAMALSIEDPRVRAVIEVSGGIPRGWEDRVRPTMPPVLIVHGTQDNIVPVTEAHKLDRLLTQHRVPHQMELLPNETHWFSAATQPRLLMTCASFLGRHL